MQDHLIRRGTAVAGPVHRLQELVAELVESSLDVPGFRECAMRVGGIWWVIRMGEAELVVRELTEAGEASAGKSTS